MFNYDYNLNNLLGFYNEDCDGNFLIRKGFMSMDQSLMFVGPNVAFFKAQGKRE